MTKEPIIEYLDNENEKKEEEKEKAVVKMVKDATKKTTEKIERIHSDVLYEVLKDYPHKIGCEVGVHTGHTAAILLERLPDIERYYAIDPWESYGMYNGKKYEKPGHKILKSWKQAILNYFEETKAFRSKLITLRMTSVEGARHVEDYSLDWVFIDANHDYAYAKENLEIWTNKVKKNGLITGHDYGNPKDERKGWDITKAIDEFLEKNNIDFHVEDKYIWWFINK